ncbi:hypothetical protein L596_028139 [Steinernema carpocapsae]|uniref:Uncharacterized protein n=1 Tax=Steinernema carpocapsae TaxID=34508 RepID=A0A4U5LXM6_STECR|nr:hypothetical protein L596_028139 [Steinernema carpocapsae]
MRRVALLARTPQRLAHLPSTSSQIFLPIRRNHAEAALSRKDQALINRGDFILAKPCSMKPVQAREPEDPKTNLADLPERVFKLQEPKTTTPEIPVQKQQPATEKAAEGSYGQLKREIFQESSSSRGVASPYLLWRCIKSDNYEGLKNLLKENGWPHHKLLKDILVSQIFKLFFERGSPEDVKELYRNFASANPKLYVRDEVTIVFLERLVRETGVISASEFAVECRKMFLIKPPSNARTYRQVVAAERLFQAAFSVEKVKYIDVFGLFDTVHELGYIEDAKPYLVEALKFKIRNEGFNAALVSYKVQLKHDRTTVGLHLLFREAVKNWSESRITFENRLRTVIKLASSLDGPFDIFGELIVAMVLEGRLAEAQVLFKKLSIPGNHFCMPLSRLSNEPENLEAVEKFAELIDSCILAERRKKSKGKAEAEPKVSADDEATARSVGFLVKDWHTTRKKYSTQKVKRYKVNDEKLDKLYNVMLRVWADLAVNSNNKESMRKLKKWIDTNQISLSEKLAERINRFLQN